MYFPTAGIETNPLIPPLVALVVSFFTSMGGVSGAFLLLPFQMSFLGFTNPSVSSTNQLFNIVAIPSGVYRYIKEGRMVWPLTWIVVLGTLPGVLIGAVVRVNYLPDPRNFKLFVAVVLLYVGCRMVLDLLGKKTGGQNNSAAERKFREQVKNFRESGGQDAQARVVCVDSFTLRQISYRFYGECFTVNTLGIFALSFVVGIVGGTYGIGGGSIIAPFFVAIYRLPVYTVAGAALMGTFVTSVAGVVFYQAMAPFYPNMSVAPDYLLGVLFGLGGMYGMYLGAKCQKYVPAKVIKWMLAGLIVFLAGSYVLDFLA